MGHLADCLAAGRPLDTDRLVQDALLTEEVATAVAAGAAPHHLLPPSANRPRCPVFRKTASHGPETLPFPTATFGATLADSRVEGASILACRSWGTPLILHFSPFFFFFLIRLCITVRGECCAGAGATVVNRQKQ